MEEQGLAQSASGMPSIKDVAMMLMQGMAPEELIKKERIFGPSLASTSPACSQLCFPGRYGSQERQWRSVSAPGALASSPSR